MKEREGEQTRLLMSKTKTNKINEEIVFSKLFQSIISITWLKQNHKKYFLKLHLTSYLQKFYKF